MCPESKTQNSYFSGTCTYSETFHCVLRQTVLLHKVFLRNVHVWNLKLCKLICTECHNLDTTLPKSKITKLHLFENYLSGESIENPLVDYKIVFVWNLKVCNRIYLERIYMERIFPDTKNVLTNFCYNSGCTNRRYLRFSPNI